MAAVARWLYRGSGLERCHREQRVLEPLYGIAPSRQLVLRFAINAASRKLLNWVYRPAVMILSWEIKGYHGTAGQRQAFWSHRFDGIKSYGPEHLA